MIFWIIFSNLLVAYLFFCIGATWSRKEAIAILHKSKKILDDAQSMREDVKEHREKVLRMVEDYLNDECYVCCEYKTDCRCNKE